MSDELWPGGVPEDEEPGATAEAAEADAAPAKRARKPSAKAPAKAAPPAAAPAKRAPRSRAAVTTPPAQAAPAAPAAAADPLADYEPAGTPLPAPAATEQPPAGERPAPPVLPVDAAAEVSVLAALLTTPDTFDDVNETLDPEDFGVPAHEAIYRAIVNCDAAGKPFDPISVADELTRAGALNRVGGLDGLRELAASGSTTDTVSSHVAIIRDRSLRRRLAGAARVIGSTALSPKTDAIDALATAEATVFELGQKREKSTAAEMPLVVANVFEQMAKARNSKLLGHSTGFAELDRLTGGWQAGQLIIVAGRPGMGKSVLALQWARLIAELSDTVVPFLSYEMNQTELGMRMLSSATGIDLGMILRGQIPDGMDRIVAAEAAKMSQLRLLVDGNPPRTISGVRSYARKLARRGPLGAVVVDYAQLMEGEGRRKDENRAQEVSDISRGLKVLADELEVPVIACSQLNRGLESRPNRRPQLSDLRESGSLEQDAAIVIGCFREWVYDKSASDSDAELLLLKNRNGQSGVAVAADFEGRCVRYKDTTRRLNDGPPQQPAGGGGSAGGTGGGFGGGARAGSWSSSDPF